MDNDQIRVLADRGTYQGKLLKGNLEETHASWVILSSEFAFKIKKPVKLSFLDYSTLRKRKVMCEKELRLNRRFSPIYQGVFPVRTRADEFAIGGHAGKVVDYAVVMSRLKSSKQMNRMLERGRVTVADMKRLAHVVAEFHQHAKVVRKPFDLRVERTLFNDIQSIRRFVTRSLGRKYADIISEAVRWSDAFLRQNRSRFSARIQAGFTRDLHGDLHCSNVFLYRQPILFDCIEFNDDYRHRDVLDEIGFLTMDIESFGKFRLAKSFLDEYSTCVRCLHDPLDERILQYYKCYRANVRAKVEAIAAMEKATDDLNRDRLKGVMKYLSLIRRYIGRVRNGIPVQ